MKAEFDAEGCLVLVADNHAERIALLAWQATENRGTKIEWEHIGRNAPWTCTPCSVTYAPFVRRCDYCGAKPVSESN